MFDDAGMSFDTSFVKVEGDKESDRPKSKALSSMFSGGDIST